MYMNELLNTISQESIDSLVKDFRRQRKMLSSEVVTTMIGMKGKDIVIYISC